MFHQLPEKLQEKIRRLLLDGNFVEAKHLYNDYYDQDTHPHTPHNQKHPGHTSFEDLGSRI